MSDPSTAEELFASYLARMEDDDGWSAVEETRFAAWVSAEHPDHADALYELRERWLAFRPVLERGRPRSESEARAVEVLARLRGRAPGAERFELRGEIGAGGMGRVHRAFDPELGRELALKVAREREGESAGTARRRTARLLDEARITGQLHHPGVVPVHELGLDASGRVYYTMPLIEGEDLEAVFDRVRRDEPEWTRVRALGFLLRVCETMAYAHERGVVHGDLKPANVRVGRFGEVTVMDWGLARVVGGARDEAEEPRAGHAAPAASASRLSGTPGYLAPERILAPGAPPDPRADVYAVGAMLHHLLTGRVPLADDPVVRDLDDLRRLRARAPDPSTALQALAPQAAPELHSICARAIAPLERRHPDMASLARDLRAFLEGRAVPSHATGAWVELRKWVGRNRGLAVTLAGLVVSLALGFGVATALGVRAGRETARVLRLSDLRRHEELVARAELLWPALPSRADAYRAWLDEARALGARLPAHRRTLDELRAGGTPDGAGGWSFDGTEAQWHHDTLAALVGLLAGFTEPEAGRVADVERRLAFAETVEERSIGSPAARAAWARAIASIADPAASPAYGGLRIAPQLGLLPLGPDPDSGLEEFAHLASGAPPVRDAQGILALGEESGVVLVLVPGGEFLLGAQSSDPDAPGFAPGAFANEGPPHEVALAPFLISRFELTQAQWLRATGANPSTHSPATDDAITLLHPVETVSRGEAARVLERLALALPTEAQWEYAARAGRPGPWWTGADPRSLAGAANLADRTVVRAGGEWPQIETWLDDGFFRHAPVDALAPNPFGLVHVHGNVWEWCADRLGGYDLPVRAGDGLRLAPAEGLAVGRGGGYVNNAAFARVSLRDGRPDAPHVLYGVRPARALDP